MSFFQRHTEALRSALAGLGLSQVAASRVRVETGRDGVDPCIATVTYRPPEGGVQELKRLYCAADLDRLTSANTAVCRAILKLATGCEKRRLGLA